MGKPVQRAVETKLLVVVAGNNRHIRGQCSAGVIRNQQDAAGWQTLQATDLGPQPPLDRGPKGGHPSFNQKRVESSDLRSPDIGCSSCAAPSVDVNATLSAEMATLDWDSVGREFS